MSYIVATTEGQVTAVADDWMELYEVWEAQEAPEQSLSEAIGLKVEKTWPDQEGAQPMTFRDDEARYLAEAIGGRAIEA